MPIYPLRPGENPELGIPNTVQNLVRYGLDRLELPRVIAVIAPDNHASRRVLQKVGLIHWRDNSFKGIPVEVYASDSIGPQTSKSSGH